MRSFLFGSHDLSEQSDLFFSLPTRVIDSRSFVLSTPRLSGLLGDVFLVLRRVQELGVGDLRGKALPAAPCVLLLRRRCDAAGHRRRLAFVS